MQCCEAIPHPHWCARASVLTGSFTLHVPAHLAEEKGSVQGMWMSNYSSFFHSILHLYGRLLGACLGFCVLSQAYLSVIAL